MAFRIDYTHSLDPQAARARMHALGDYLSNKHGISVRWTDDDHATVTGKYLVVSIEGVLTIEAKNVRFEGKDPGMLWRGKAKDYLTGKLDTYLNPATSLESLPRQ